MVEAILFNGFLVTQWMFEPASSVAKRRRGRGGWGRLRATHTHSPATWDFLLEGSFVRTVTFCSSISSAPNPTTDRFIKGNWNGMQESIELDQDRKDAKGGNDNGVKKKN